MKPNLKKKKSTLSSEIENKIQKQYKPMTQVI